MTASSSTDARMLATLAPLSEELLVFPSTVLKAEPAAEPFALAFAIPCNAKGLKFICRDTYDLGRSHFDAPLASRFEEMDASSSSTTCWCRGSACSCAATSRDATRFTRDQRGRPHDASGGSEKRREGEFVLGLAARIAEVTDASQSAARARAPRRDDHDYRDDARVPARRRSRRGRRQMGRLRAGAPAARHRAQSFPEALSADGGNHPAQQLSSPDGDAVGRDFASPMKSDIEKYFPPPAPMRTSASRCIASHGMSRAAPSRAARFSTSASSSATRSGWRARWSTTPT